MYAKASGIYIGVYHIVGPKALGIQKHLSGRVCQGLQNYLPAAGQGLALKTEGTGFEQPRPAELTLFCPWRGMAGAKTGRWKYIKHN